MIKQLTAYSLVLLSCTLLSCGSNESSKEGEQKAAPAAMLSRNANKPLKNIPAPLTDVNLFSARLANDYIDRYMKTNNKIAQRSFVFRTEELLNYLNSSGSAIVNFIVGQNITNDSLFLFLAPVNQQGQDEFYERNDTCFVMGETYEADLSTDLEDQQSTIDTYFIEAMNIPDAQAMIDSYALAGSIPNKNNGWLYNAHDLAGYLQAGMNTARGMPYTQFILAIKNGKIDMVIVGSDGSNHMYFNYNGQKCVMENLSPCPVCNVVSGGSIFDASSCTY